MAVFSKVQDGIINRKKEKEKEKESDENENRMKEGPRCSPKTSQYGF